jgi:gluconate 2-dehydrogenase gamma chain
MATGTTRRHLLAATASIAGASWLGLHWPAVQSVAQAAQTARSAGVIFQELSAADGADLEAITARIIPADDTPGAREAGVVWFIDQALGGFLADRREELQAGLATFNAAAGKRFAALPEFEQDRFLATQDQTPFFEFVRTLTLIGMLAMPSYGGNRDLIGWQLIGFEHRHAWTSPFGHYDTPGNEND